MLSQEAASKARGAGRWVLFLLTFINLLNYLDRYILVALSPAIKRDLSLSDTEVGFLTTAFMFSYFLVSPIFGYLGDRLPRFRVMSVGVALWSVATAASGWGKSAQHLLLARFSVGVGEAAYGSIAPSLLRDLFPKTVCGRVFALFFMAIPVGSALGFMLGGALEKWLGWRQAFFVAGTPGILLAVALLFLREPQRGAFDPEEEKGERTTLKLTYRALGSNVSYVLTVLGYCAYTFVLGGIAVWIPHYIERYLGVPAAEGNMVFGAITVVAGFIGTMVGGAWADRWAKRGADAYLKLSALSMFAALPVYLLVLQVHHFGLFCVLVFLLEFLLFLSTSPINAEIVNCVPARMRATASAMAIFSIHLLGDAISPPLVGWISDHSNLYQGMSIFTFFILLAGLVWGWKVVGAWEAMPWPEGALQLPLSQCHRGYHPSGIQENTLAAFRAAAEAGAPMVELDVRLSRDGVPVVIHDPDIARVANGRPGLVRELSAQELRDLAQAPSLREVLEDPACRKLLVNIELKREGARECGLEQAVAIVIRDCQAQGRVLCSSFNPLALRSMWRLLPEVPRALLATEEPDPNNRFYLRKMLLAFLARPHMVNLDHRYVNERLARALEQRHVPFAVWTVDNPAQAKKFLAMGAKSIISPQPRVV